MMIVIDNLFIYRCDDCKVEMFMKILLKVSVFNLKVICGIIVMFCFVVVNDYGRFFK